MSHKEIDRLMVIEQCDNRTIRQSVAARQLGISPRHLRRLLKRYRTEGAAGLVHRRRGQVANNHSGWRVPNINELRSIVELQCYHPAINLTIFPNTPIYYYWSSSPYAASNYTAWSVSFGSGYADDVSKAVSRFVRLVRGL